MSGKRPRKKFNVLSDEDLRSRLSDDSDSEEASVGFAQKNAPRFHGTGSVTSSNATFQSSSDMLETERQHPQHIVSSAIPQGQKHSGLGLPWANNVTQQPVSSSALYSAPTDRRVHPTPPPATASRNSDFAARSPLVPLRRSAARRSITKIPVLPKNCKEKIIFCIDISREMFELNYRSRSGEVHSAVNILQKALSIFLFTKQRINQSHEYGVVFFTDKAFLLYPNATVNNNGSINSNPLTTNIQALMKMILKLNETPTANNNPFDLSSLFDVILKECPPVHPEAGQVPEFITRVILVFGRSYSEPFISRVESQIEVQSCSSFFVDILYLHRPPDHNNRCQDIFKFLCDLDLDGMSYILEESKDLTKIYSGLAALLAHPLQRALQKDSNYQLDNTPAAASQVEREVAIAAAASAFEA